MSKARLLAPILVLTLVAMPGPGAKTVDGLVFLNGTTAQIDRMLEAAERFHAVGLDLPDLEVSFHSDKGPCNGHLGLFRPGEILICTHHEFIYEHELAHAWEHSHLEDGKRREFMELRDHDNWFDASRPWNERGGEDAAFIIQQGLLDEPLPTHLPSEIEDRLAAFEVLTGKQSPRTELAS